MNILLCIGAVFYLFFVVYCVALIIDIRNNPMKYYY